MKITERKLRAIIKSVIKENEMRDASIAHAGINAPTSFQKAHEDGIVSDMEFYSTGPDSKYYPGHYYTKQQEREAKEISKMKIGPMKDRKIKQWCRFNNLTLGDFFQCCKQIGC